MRLRDQTFDPSLARTAAFTLAACLPVPACVIEEIDAILSERGMTYYSTSAVDTSESSDSEGSSGTGTGTSSETTLLPEPGSSSTPDPTPASTTGDPTTESESTGTPDSVCGNGILEGDETCDDGNTLPGDGCQVCAKDSIIFITSEVYQGFALGGLHGADQRCHNLATKAGLPNPLSYTAWLSTPSTPAANRLVHSQGRYVLINGLVVAQDWDALTTETLETTITVDENSQTQDLRAWTGTMAGGQPAGSEFCDDWEDSGVFKTGGTGLSISTDETWSYFGEVDCVTELHLYCIEQ